MDLLLQLVIEIFPIASLIFIIAVCGGKQNGDGPKSTKSVNETAQKEPTNTVDGPKNDGAADVGSKEEFVEKKENEAKEEKPKEEKRDVEKDVFLDDKNEHINFIVENCKTRDPAILREFCIHAKLLNEQIGCFQWAMKKRFVFDETSWKHLSRRISLLKAEGFDVRVNTRKAKENKAQTEAKPTRIDAILNQKNAGKKKKAKNLE
ncbi:unnamed protein product [Caenorhabditis bovis]|uniref:Uncharacterized protein n=1 Tax=Caenorhabditis bovis TaxID=2654633 RepID=A0A8S1EYE6_9PELO|nr:unnamed protein product [Caenorhabditis bovis]